MKRDEMIGLIEGVLQQLEDMNVAHSALNVAKVEFAVKELRDLETALDVKVLAEVKGWMHEGEFVLGGEIKSDVAQVFTVWPTQQTPAHRHVRLIAIAEPEEGEGDAD